MRPKWSLGFGVTSVSYRPLMSLINDPNWLCMLFAFGRVRCGALLLVEGEWHGSLSRKGNGAAELGHGCWANVLG